MPIFWFIRFNQILFKPFVLLNQRFDAVIEEIICFSGEDDEVDWSKVETVH